MHDDVKARIGQDRWLTLEEAGYVWDGMRGGWLRWGEPETFLSLARVLDSCLAAANLRKVLGDERMRATLAKTRGPFLVGDQIANAPPLPQA